LHLITIPEKREKKLTHNCGCREKEGGYARSFGRTAPRKEKEREDIHRRRVYFRDFEKKKGEVARGAEDSSTPNLPDRGHRERISQGENRILFSEGEGSE